MTKFYVTRWWGSQGIVEMDGEVQESEAPGDKGRTFFVAKVHGQPTCFGIHTEAFPSLEAATLRVHTLAERKIEALKAQAKAIEERWLS